ncbi:hypothetical protein GLYMA_02G191000v4 [Glycine max]|nr:hypothetical protein GLYMA_02G191000v4 [Glycine max]KAH1061075.1 hypothetical protein GYH30_004532 [Glycine max]
MLYIVGPVLHTLTFEYVEGPSVKDVFLEFGSRDVDKECMDNIASQIGHAIGKLHDCGLVHGDLTTSNILKEWYQSVDGLDTCCIPQVIKAVLIHIEQTSTSAAKRTEEDHGWMKISEYMISLLRYIKEMTTNECYQCDLSLCSLYLHMNLIHI